jgi:pantothenate kinase
LNLPAANLKMPRISKTSRWQSKGARVTQVVTKSELAKIIRDRAPQTGRFIVALAGPPSAGKSTLADELVAKLGRGARNVPMDGFHYDDAVLIARGLRHRKGAPDTFDASGFLHLLRRLRIEGEVAIPLFDRALELSRGSASILGPEDRILIVEGNYLLLNAAPWDQVADLVDMTVWLDVTEAELDRRLLKRWDFYGKTPQEARDWIDGNDMPNIRLVTQGSRPAEFTLRWP